MRERRRATGHAVWGAGGGAVCEIDGWVLGVLFARVTAESDGRCAAWVLFCNGDERVLGGLQFHAVWGGGGTGLRD